MGRDNAHGGVEVGRERTGGWADERGTHLGGGVAAGMGMHLVLTKRPDDKITGAFLYSRCRM